MGCQHNRENGSRSTPEAKEERRTGSFGNSVILCVRVRVHTFVLNAVPKSMSREESCQCCIQFFDGDSQLAEKGSVERTPACRGTLRLGQMER